MNFLFGKALFPIMVGFEATVVTYTLGEQSVREKRIFAMCKSV